MADAAVQAVRQRLSEVVGLVTALERQVEQQREERDDERVGGLLDQGPDVG